MPRVHASRLAEAALVPFLADLAPNLNFAYLETATDASWSRYMADLQLDQVVRGRAFGLPCDVQFWRRGDGFQVRVLTDLARQTPNGDGIDLGAFDADDVTYLLWGRQDRDSGVWTEPGFVRTWRYPLPDAARVAVRATEYRDRAGGALQFVRYRDLVAFSDSEEAP